MSKPKSILAERLTLLRTESGLSQYKLAGITGFSRGLIANYEQGRREPDYNTLLTLANLYHVSIDYLLGRVEERNAIYSHFKLNPEFIDIANNLTSESQEDLGRYIRLLKLRDSSSVEDSKPQK